MTRVFIMPFMFMAAAVTWFADWTAGTTSDVPKFFLWLAIAYAGVDFIRFFYLWRRQARVRGITITTYGDDPDFDRRWDEAMKVLHVNEDDNGPDVRQTRFDVRRKTT